MHKRALKPEHPKAKGLVHSTTVGSPSTRGGSRHEVLPPAIQELVANIDDREFSSREEALSFMIDRVISRLEGEVERQTEMRDFLRLLIDTDPILREDLLRSVKLRR